MLPDSSCAEPETLAMQHANQTSQTHGFATILLGLPVLWLSGRCAASDPSTPAVLTVTSKVVAQNVEPIGANLTSIAGGTNFAINNHVWNSGFEPAV